MTWYGLIRFVLFVSILASPLSRFQLAIILASHHATPKPFIMASGATTISMPAAGSPVTFGPAYVAAPWNLPPAEPTLEPLAEPSPVSEPEAPPAKRARVVVAGEEESEAAANIKWARVFVDQAIYEAVMASGLNHQARDALLAAPTYRAAECRGHRLFDFKHVVAGFTVGLRFLQIDVI